MKAGIDSEGVLYIEAESTIESYALKKWSEENAICGDKKVDIDVKHFGMINNNGVYIL